VVETRSTLVTISGKESAVCEMPSGCTFAYALSLTPVLTQTSPLTANEGDTITIKGHAFSTTASENMVTIGGEPCVVLTAAVDSTFVPPNCTALSCTQEMRTLVSLTCRLPILDSTVPHTISVSVSGKGASPALPGGNIRVLPVIRSMSPIRGSLAGGTLVNLYGDGLSKRMGDLDVRLGSVICRVLTSNASHVTCLTNSHTTLTQDRVETLAVRVRGVLAGGASFSFTFATSSTPVLTTAAVADRTSLTNWLVTVSGSGFLSPASANVIYIGSTRCVPTGTGTSTQITCNASPPLSGSQAVTLVNVGGSARGGSSLPTVTGISLTLSGLSPTTVSLAGGAELVINGAGFSESSSRVTVCDVACPIRSVASTSLRCTVPSRLLLLEGTQGLNLSVATAAELDLGYAAPPPPPPGVAAVVVASDALTLRRGRSVLLNFAGLTNINLPRGSNLTRATLRVAPQSGGGGSVLTLVHATLHCSSTPSPLSTAMLNALLQTNETIEWEMQPYDLGFASDESPDFSSLLLDDVTTSTGVQGCSLVVLLHAKDGPGVRSFYSPFSNNTFNRPELRLLFDPPSTVAQTAWATDASCPVQVSVPTTLPASATLSCSAPFDALSSVRLGDTNSCPHLQLEATAATSTATCALSVNGLNLMSSCGLDRLVVGRDGVCVAAINPPDRPRTACFDTKTQGQGAEKLASWIDALPLGTQVMIASCSRLSWAHNRNNLTSVFATLGARNPPTRIDDAYSLVGFKGATTPLAEARTPCCTNPSGPLRVCQTCSQALAKATSIVECGASISFSNSSIVRESVLGTEEPWQPLSAASDATVRPTVLSAYKAAILTVPDGSTSEAGSTTAPAINSLVDVITSLQSQDVDTFDQPCTSSLANSYGSRHGAGLATDGDGSSYWLSVGRNDTLFTVDLGMDTAIRALNFTWKYPASTVLVLASDKVTGNADADWAIAGGSFGTAPAQIALSDPTGRPYVQARRLRIYMAGAASATWPMFGLSSLVSDSCEVPRVTQTVGTNLAYARSATPRVLSVTPRRGSTAGGTALTITVEGLPTSVTASQVSVTIAGKACTVSLASASSNQVRCTTGSYGVTSLANPGLGSVQLTIASVGTAAATAEATYEYIDLWSRRTTWGGAGYTIPGLETAGDSVWIQNGQRILLDCSVRLYMLIVQGVLQFDRVNINLDANYIFVMGGSFIVGTEREPFMQKAVITLHGSPVSQEIPVYGAKTLSCRFCTLDLHGKPLLAGRTHTKLAQTVSAGATYIDLMEPVSWDVDSQIVITSTHFNGTFEEAETNIIDSLLNGGTRIRLVDPLKFGHLGQTFQLDGGKSVDFRANVAILSRNVVLQGNAMSELDKHGMHIMLHSRTHESIADRSNGESLIARIENIEVRYAGQFGRMGRYPIHFHMIGAVRNSYVRRNSIHHTYNRAIAIHGVHYLRVQGNVAFETRGHTYFVEDGVETKNVITGNLGANTRESFTGLTSDATPATYWLVNGDNYVERNIAAGSTHYGFWFFPEPKVRGTSEFDPGCSDICPQGIPVYRFADNEAHNNGRYGLRIFTGRSPHNGEGMPGFYPVTARSCDPVGPNNTFAISRFERQYSWRNGKNGISFGSVAAVHIVDAVVADNCMRGIEGTGADGLVPGIASTETKMRGPWGYNKLVRPLFVGHPLRCPECSQSWKPYFPEDHGPAGWRGRVRLGLEQPAWLGLVVENATFINYDREGMVAVGGFAKAFPPEPTGYDFSKAGAMETRFSGVTWLQSPNRVQWRWNDEALFYDIDGTFADQPFCAGCSVLKNDLVSNSDAFPDCYQDARYDGTVCKPTYKIVQAGFLPQDPLMIIQTMRVSHRNQQGMYVRSNDATFLRNKWMPAGQFNFVEMDVSTEVMTAAVIGELDKEWQGSWNNASGVWIGERMARFTFSYTNWHDQSSATRVAIGIFSESGTSLSWVNGSDHTINGTVQLNLHVIWYRCELVPEQCTNGAVQYPSMASHTIARMGPPGMNLANTPHFEGSKYQTQFVVNRTYMLEPITNEGIFHLESTTITVGNNLGPYDWIEF